MEFGLAITRTYEIRDKSNLIHSLSDDLESYFEDRFYGNGIKAYTIGIVCVSPRFDQFYTDKRPKYTKGKKVITEHGISFTIEDSFEYKIKLDFEAFKNAKESEVEKILAKEILASLEVNEAAIRKIKDFDFAGFTLDLTNYFQQRHLEVF